MSGVKSPLTINGTHVVSAPAEIDVTTAEQLRVILLHSAAEGQATVVVDMTRTRFCDSAGWSVLVRGHNRALAEGGELRLVVPSGGAVFRIFTLTGLHRVIPWFSSLDQAIVREPTPAIRPPHPRPPIRVGRAQQSGRPDVHA